MNFSDVLVRIEFYSRIKESMIQNKFTAALI